VGYRRGCPISANVYGLRAVVGSEVVLHKNLSTPEDRSVGVMSGLEKLAQMGGMSLSTFLGQCDAIVHAPPSPTTP